MNKLPVNCGIISNYLTHVSVVSPKKREEKNITETIT